MARRRDVIHATRLQPGEHASGGKAGVNTHHGNLAEAGLTPP
ncbi:MAG: hypothetical protein N838_21470 [Thiohalocapsa sp. PB-PSB1]|nr:MAG: hypothetical protein N838_21470 [Thiohalocapsa sp. PB-PSB1]